MNAANDAIALGVAGRASSDLSDALRGVPEDSNPLATISYVSAPLTQPLDVVGAPLVTIAQTSTHQLIQQLDAKVWDVSDEGTQLIWRGGLSANNGNEVSFRLWPNAHRFEPGHRIRLSISSTDFPTFKPDDEPWTSTISLAGTRLDLPTVTDAKHPGSAKESHGVFVGAMGGLLWLSLFGVTTKTLLRRR